MLTEYIASVFFQPYVVLKCRAKENCIEFKVHFERNAAPFFFNPKCNYCPCMVTKTDGIYSVDIVLGVLDKTIFFCLT